MRAEEIPQFTSEDDERKFWATHDSTDYADTATPVVLEYDKRMAAEEKLKVLVDGEWYEASKELQDTVKRIDKSLNRKRGKSRPNS